MITKEQIKEKFMLLQDSICAQMESLEDNAQFVQDQWERPEGGGGRTRIIQGKTIEKGGVNFSAVHGKTPDKISKALGIENSNFFASGVSIVMHPKNPHCPIIHMNVRYFEMEGGEWWFGGGIDLTPHYIIPEDAKYFHTELKSVCDKHNTEYYPKFKKWADDYFFIKHRNETRGVGGIFFDRLNTKSEGKSKDELFDYVLDVGNLFAPLYLELIFRNQEKQHTPENKNWQSLRRGRYVEFNLVWDKGTKFGLDTNGRTESILMSMPPKAIWEYCYETNSAEEATQKLLTKDIDWVNYNLK